jgi:uncharacterized protein GlcG (DUF336 family)
MTLESTGTTVFFRKLRQAFGNGERGIISVLIKSSIGLLITAIVMLTGCSGGSGGETTGDAGANEPPANTLPAGCVGNCASPTNKLSVTDVQTIIAQAVAEATAQGVGATISVVDRVGNVLGVYQMANAPALSTITGGKGPVGGLEDVMVPSTTAAIAKSITPAYLSSEGNAFTTRTASQIIQPNFNPGENGQPGGPLFGVQFSQLACSDFSARFTGGPPGPGTHRSPLGFAADPGGLPLYMNGALVGGIGIETDGIYTFDPIVTDIDLAVDEIVAVAGSFGYAAPTDRRADRITVDGKTLRFSDATPANLATDPSQAPPFSTLGPGIGSVVAVTGYSNATIVAGTAFGEPESGVRPSTPADFPRGLDSFVVVDATNTNRFPPIAGTDGSNALTANEVRTMLIESIKVSNRTRSQVRRPVGVQARVSVYVVDTNGAVLGLLLTRDPLLDSLDVTLLKARTVAFFSGSYAGSDLRNAPNATDPSTGTTIVFRNYVNDVKTFFGIPTALDDGGIAFSDRALGNISRPNFPDGLTGTPNGPLSKPIDVWSPFNVGLQLDLVVDQVVAHVLFVAGVNATDVTQNCTGIARLPNGITQFPGAVPIYRGNQLVGAIASSGDGIEQDDMIPFLGLSNAADILGTINQAPMNIRSDQFSPQGVRLRYVLCPQKPFLDSEEQRVCNGK